MSARRQRQADAEQRRKELVEQLERSRLLESVKGSSEVLEPVEWEDMKTENRVTKNAPSTPEDYPVLGCFHGDEPLPADGLPPQGTAGVDRSTGEEQEDAAIPEVPPNTDPVPDSPLTAERQDDLGDEQRTDDAVPGDTDKATSSGDGWE